MVALAKPPVGDRLVVHAKHELFCPACFSPLVGHASYGIVAGQLTAACRCFACGLVYVLDPHTALEPPHEFDVYDQPH